MASSSRSGSSKIKSKEELIGIIFRPNESADVIERLENAKQFTGQALFKQYPPNFQDLNKKALFDQIKDTHKYKPSKGQNVLLARFHPSPLPQIYKSQQNIKAYNIQFTSNVFDYKPIKESNVVEWHMNFANYDIFSFYGGSLLAQDELQVLECPQLASVREFLLQEMQPDVQNSKPFNPRVIEGNRPYPILVSNIERVIDLDIKNLYGNKFSTSPTSTILKSYTYLEKPQIVNVLAIEAPKYGSGSYTRDQIEYVLQACYTGYLGARSLAYITYELNNKQSTKDPLKTIIHTGWFGCGAYGGNRTIMIILQALAAGMADIDELIFHTVTDNCQQEIMEAKGFLKELFDEGSDTITMDTLINKIVEKRFPWGSSNNT